MSGSVDARAAQIYNLCGDCTPKGQRGERIVQVRINGKERDVEAGTTVAMLLRELDAAPQRVAVEINRELVPRSTFEETFLSEGDTIEIVTFVGGG